MNKKNILNLNFFMIFTLIIISLLVFSCQTPSSNSSGDGSSKNNDENLTPSTLTFVSRDSSTSFNKAQNLSISNIQFATQDLPMDMIDKVYFRSSDIEFWSINSISDIDDLMSAKYVDDDASLPVNLQKSIFAGLPDIEETFIFIPGMPSIFSPNSKPVFEKKKYNLIRLDIGGGPISFMINGDSDPKYPKNSSGEASDGIGGKYLNCNSIFLIDQEYLDHNVYISRNNARDIEDGVDTSGNAAIDSILKNSNIYANHNSIPLENGWIDVDGALFISFDAVDFNDYPSIENITVDLSWDMNDLLTYEDNGTPLDFTDDYDYRMQDRVEKTCFDFNVDLIIE